MQALEPEKRAALSRLILDARKGKGWTRERTIEEAETALRALAESEDVRKRDREVYRTTEITRHHLAALENCPARPLNDARRRARLLGVALALGIGRDAINRHAGGI